MSTSLSVGSADGAALGRSLQKAAGTSIGVDV